MSRKEKIVTTIHNEEVSISACRKFPLGWYKIGKVNEEKSGDCYLINDKYYRYETDQVVFDHELKKHVLKNDSVVLGVIAFDKCGHTLGYFTLTNKNILTHTLNGDYYVIDENLFKTTRVYREQLSTGEYYHIEMLDSKEFNKIKTPSKEYKTSLPYDSKDVLDDFLKVYTKLDIPVNANIEKYAPIMKDLTFGLEFETVAGYIPNRQINNLGLIPLRDGSIEGIEYVSVPLSGEKGLQTTVNITEVLAKKTKFDNTCALHLHIGGVPRTKEFILAFLKTTLFIQEDIYKMFPLYKKYNFRIKNKNYSKPYDPFLFLSQMDPVITKENIDENFNIFFQYLSMGTSFSEYKNDLENVLFHPYDRDGHQKWNVRTRYYIHNLIPLIFGNKKTIEFRIHTPTFDSNKIIPFIFMNGLIVQFVMNNTKAILENKKYLSKFSGLKDLLHLEITNHKVESISKFYDSMMNYIDIRTSNTEIQNRNGEIQGKEEDISSCRYIKWNIPISEKKEVEESFYDESIKYVDNAFKNARKLEQEMMTNHSNMVLAKAMRDSKSNPKSRYKTPIEEYKNTVKNSKTKVDIVLEKEFGFNSEGFNPELNKMSNQLEEGFTVNDLTHTLEEWK